MLFLYTNLLYFNTRTHRWLLYILCSNFFSPSCLSMFMKLLGDLETKCCLLTRNSQCTTWPIFPRSLEFLRPNLPTRSLLCAVGACTIYKTKIFKFCLSRIGHVPISWRQSPKVYPSLVEKNCFPPTFAFTAKDNINIVRRQGGHPPRWT